MKRTIESYTYLRVLATYAVILLHSASPLLYKYNYLSDSDWMAANIYDSVTRWCVPLFFMLSGALLLNPKKSNEPLSVFFKKRINKVIVPLLIWSAIYYLFSVLIENKADLSIKSFMRNFLNNDIYYHLWFLYIMFGLYLITPILRVLTNHTSKQLLEYMLLIWFIGNPMFGLLNHVFNLNIFLDIPIDDYLGYFLLGYYLHTYALKRSTRKILYILALISLFTTAFGTYYETVKNSGTFAGYFYGYLSPNTTIVSTAIFLIFRNSQNLKKNIYIDYVSKMSLGIYLVHVMVLRSLYLSSFSVFSFSPLVSIPALSIAIFLISFLITFVLQKMPIIRRIVP